jgi:hypothetical protein
MDAQQTIPMPARGDRSAPRFDPKQPRELRRYFADLDFVFQRANVTTDQSKKQHACRYADVDTSELWEALPACTDNTKTYDEFKAEVLALYPGAEEERKWSVTDMDALIGERSRLGIISLSDLGDYYRQFLAITTFLRSKTRLSDAEQSRAFVRGFQPELWARISQRLQLKLPDHFPDDPYPLEAIHSAARYVLHGTPSTVLLLANPTPAIASATATTSPAASGMKTEDLAAILERITDTFVKALASNRGSSAERQQRCNFCGSPEHFIIDCKTVDEYIRNGLCRRNQEGQVILSTGAWLPRDIPGRWLQQRFDEWHRRNPNQRAAAQLIYNVLSQKVATANVETESLQPKIATRATHPEFADNFEPRPCPQLTASARIESLERELFQLKGRRFQPVARTRAQHDAENSRRINAESHPVRDTSVDIPEDPPRPKKQVRLVPEVVIPVAPVAHPAPTATSTSRDPPPEEAIAERSEPAAEHLGNSDPVIHPFADAQDATYIPPSNRNFATLPKATAAKKPEPAYRTIPPIYDGQVATDVYNRAMSTAVTITQRELLSLSPEVRSQVREATSAKRNAPKEGPKEVLALDGSQSDTIDPFDEQVFESHPTGGLLYPEDSPPSTPANIVARQSIQPPDGALIVPDPYEVYLKNLPEGQAPDVLIVAKESSALRSILPLVDNQQRVESILDPGSQIIAMSEDVCMDLALIYDPTIILNMQSANGEIDKSLGLARNVPMQIGEITLYIQIHIIRSPAYDILLGRPFDILTESVVRNFANEDQTITIYDPNSGQRATIPTYPRGRPRHAPKRPSFTTSRS